MVIFNFYFNIFVGILNCILILASKYLNKNNGFEKWDEDICNKAKSDFDKLYSNHKVITRAIKTLMYAMIFIPIINILMMFVNVMDILFTVQGNKAN